MLAILLTALLPAGCSITGDSGSAAALFKEKCAMCHPDGGNIMRGTKGLKRADLQKNNIQTAADIAAYIRKPGPDMPTFDVKILTDAEAAALAEYILKTFK